MLTASSLRLSMQRGVQAIRNAVAQRIESLDANFLAALNGYIQVLGLRVSRRVYRHTAVSWCSRPLGRLQLCPCHATSVAFPHAADDGQQGAGAAAAAGGHAGAGTAPLAPLACAVAAAGAGTARRTPLNG